MDSIIADVGDESTLTDRAAMGSRTSSEMYRSPIPSEIVDAVQSSLLGLSNVLLNPDIFAIS